MTDHPAIAMPFPGIFRVTTPTPFPGLPHVHVYVAQGEGGGVVVIDTAMPGEETFRRLTEGLSYLDRTVTDIEAIYLTHCHPDHFGGAGRLQEASGAPVICHPYAKDQLERMRRPDASRLERMITTYTEHGWNGEAAMESRASSFFSQMVLPTEMRTIGEGDAVRFADGDWTVHWTPGHELGHVVFHRPADGVLLVGDTVLSKITPHIGWMPSGPGPLEGLDSDPLGQFLESLEKVAKLGPSLTLPGHGRPFDAGADRARTIAGHHAVRLRRTLEIVMRFGPIDAMGVARELFDRELMFFEERLALAETLSHLEYLRLRDRVTRSMDGGRWRYEAPRKLVP